MLALTRRAGEEVVIGDPANPLGIIRVVELHGDKVRLSFDFPREIQINRKELADQKVKSPRKGPSQSMPESESDSQDKGE
ncbi:MAG: carbon storage regulator [Phycisphaeraceae bacterium]|nr:carbon storage regulator [Phycisphaeraceae bacterium]